jgi:serine/threonine protein kinase
LLREAQAMAKLRHPNIVQVFDVGTIDDDVFVVMPYLEGGSLRGRLKANRRRPWREVLAKFLAAGDGLAAAHAAGMVHRDFKPDNVMLGAEGEVQVGDFGLARIDDDDTVRDPDAPTPTQATAGLTSTNWPATAGRTTALKRGSARCAPHRPNTACDAASSSARTSANCPSAGSI